jgi:lysophospholipase L1-like esterase
MATNYNEESLNKNLLRIDNSLKRLRTNVPSLIGSLGRIHGTNSTSPALNDATNTQVLTRSVHRTGRAGASNIQIGLANFRLSGSTTSTSTHFGEQISETTQLSAGAGGTGDGTGTTFPGGPVTYRVAIELLDGTVVQGYFGGPDNVVLPYGSGVRFCDPIGVYIPANTEFYVRTWATVSGTNIAIAGSQTVSSGAVAGKQIARKGTDFSSQFLVAGQPTGTTSVQLPPIAIIGIPDQEQVSVTYAGDSIGDGTGDVATELPHGTVGFIGRALVSVNGYDIPHSKLTRGSETVTALATDIYGWRRRSLIPESTLFINQGGTNDINSGVALATIKTNYQKIWKSAKATGARVLQTTILPRVTLPTGTYAQSGTTTVTVTMTAHNLVVGQQIAAAPSTGTAVNEFVTVASVTNANTFTYVSASALTTSGNITISASNRQTPLTNFEVGVSSVRNQINAWFKEQVATNPDLDYLVDVASVVEGTGDLKGLWANPWDTTDGTHPEQAAHVRMSALLKPYIERLDAEITS